MPHFSTRYARAIGIKLFLAVAIGMSVAESTLYALTGPFPTNNDPTTHIRFNTTTGADAKRQELIDYVWSTGLPTSTLSTASNVSFDDSAMNYNLNGVNFATLASRIDKLNSPVLGMDNYSYLLAPTNMANADRLAILMPGHIAYNSNMMTAGTGDAANALLKAGFSVLIQTMPMTAWNQDNTAVVNGETVTIIGTTTNAHNNMFSQRSALGGAGNVYRFFLEPTIQAINYFESTHSNMKDVAMIGRSGGGWTTAVAAAIDSRITLSIPVAGSAPLYVQNEIASKPDTEQIFASMFGEGNSTGDAPNGVCTYLETYTLGAYGDGRRQIMVTIPGESTGLFPTKWATNEIAGATVKGIVADAIADLGAGTWQQVYDESQSEHAISTWTIENVIMPAVSAPEPGSFALVTAAMACLIAYGCQKWM